MDEIGKQTADKGRRHITKTDVRNILYRAFRNYHEESIAYWQAQERLGELDAPGYAGLYAEGLDEPAPSNQQFSLRVGPDLFYVTITKRRGDF